MLWVLSCTGIEPCSDQTRMLCWMNAAGCDYNNDGRTDCFLQRNKKLMSYVVSELLTRLVCPHVLRHYVIHALIFSYEPWILAAASRRSSFSIYPLQPMMTAYFRSDLHAARIRNGALPMLLFFVVGTSICPWWNLQPDLELSECMVKHTKIARRW